MLVFGVDLGVTSVGFAAIRIPVASDGEILRLGSRIFPEARDPDGTPLNQSRRMKRMMRRQLRRRKSRRREVNAALHALGLLPDPKSADWRALMDGDPYALRRDALVRPLTPFELGRTLAHVAKRRHFKGRDIDEEGRAEPEDDKATTDARTQLSRELAAQQRTLGQHLAARAPTLGGAGVKGAVPRERLRTLHSTRAIVEDEFDRIVAFQAPHHPPLNDPEQVNAMRAAAFAQKPVFWRLKTLGACPLEPEAALCPKGAWLSQERRMLEKLNALRIVGGNGRDLDDSERDAILAQVRGQRSISWGGVRKALEPLFKARGETARGLKLNLEESSDKLNGNLVDFHLKGALGDAWAVHPQLNPLRAALFDRLFDCDYAVFGAQRVVIRSEADRKLKRGELAHRFATDYGLPAAQAQSLAAVQLPAGWERYSTTALERMLPELRRGVQFGKLLAGPDYEGWRDTTFPNRDRPTGEVLDKLPSPKSKEEQQRLAALRNPTVVRSLNEMRKVVNNLIELYGKPDLIRIELARDIAKSKREREDKSVAIRKLEKRRREAVKDLEANGLASPSDGDIEKWLLWKEAGERCPYTGDQIGFEALFRENKYQIEHIWPRSITFDNRKANKTLCRTDVNIKKADRTPRAAFEDAEPEFWAAIIGRLKSLGLPEGKIRRFTTRELPEGFADRQLNDTSWVAREARAFLMRLWPDVGPSAPVTVQPVNGMVTAQLRRLWGLNNILADTGEKNRADHRHHAIDALVVACTSPALVKRLSDAYANERPGERAKLAPPWESIRQDAERAIADVIVSHRVRKKVSGPLHKETIYGDTGEDVGAGRQRYRVIVVRANVRELSAKDIAATDINEAKYVIRDAHIRAVLQTHVERHDGDPKKAFATFPRVSPEGPEIRKVRVLTKQQAQLMAPVHGGFADLGGNHHVAIYRAADGKIEFEVVSLFEAMRRRGAREPIVRKSRSGGAAFVMSLAPGNIIKLGGDKAGYWVLRKIASKGQITLASHLDADPEGQKTIFEPLVGGIMSRGGTKVAVDPIGRVRPAHD